MTYNDKLNIMTGFINFRDKEKTTEAKIEQYVNKINIDRFVMEEPETRETIKKFLLELYDEELNGRKVIDPETFEIIRIK